MDGSVTDQPVRRISLRSSVSMSRPVRCSVAVAHARFAVVVDREDGEVVLVGETRPGG
jgi:hypothetical protein